MPHPLCFVLMPFGTKTGADAKTVQSDRVYRDLIEPAIRAAQLEPLRADEEGTSGIIHKPMFERLLLCRFAVADLTQLNPNVFYELGVRHAARPRSTVQVIAEGTRLPFDIQMMRTVHYKLGSAGVPTDTRRGRAAIRLFLEESKKESKKEKPDSPIYQLLDGVQGVSVPHEKADIFERQFSRAARMRDKLGHIKRLDKLKKIEAELGPLEDDEAGLLVSLMLAYRNHEGFAEMVSLVRRMPAHLGQTVFVQEQLALALNRLKQRERAEKILLNLIEDRGPTSETYGILGRVYKDSWTEAKKTGRNSQAAGYLDRAIDAYLKGFESDWRDAYPGVNAVTLMTLRNPRDPRLTELLPVVRFAAERKIGRTRGDYWDFATMVELAVLSGNQEEAERELSRALALEPAPFMRNTTIRNLRMIRQARESAGVRLGWDKTLEKSLVR